MNRAARHVLTALAAATLAAGGCGAEPPDDWIDTGGAGTGPGAAGDTLAAGSAAGDTLAADSMDVLVHFTRDARPVPVNRRVPHTRAVLRAALEQLLLGPNPAERTAGMHSWFTAETAGMLNDVSIADDGVAVVDFRNFSRVIPGASSAAGSAMLLGELLETVFQFDAVQAVEFRFDGSCDAFWNWLQRDCGVVAR